MMMIMISRWEMDDDKKKKNNKRETDRQTETQTDRQTERDWGSVGGDHNRWRKATLMKLFWRLMSRQHSEIQNNNNTYSYWTK